MSPFVDKFTFDYFQKSGYKQEFYLDYNHKTYLTMTHGRSLIRSLIIIQF